MRIINLNSSLYVNKFYVNRIFNIYQFFYKQNYYNIQIMFQGRTPLIFNKNKSKLVIKRPINTRQDHQENNQNKNLLCIKQITIYNQERNSPFVIRKLPLSLQKKRSSSRKQTLKPITNKANNSQKQKRQTIKNVQAQQSTMQQTQQSLENIQSIVNKLIQMFFAAKFIKSKDNLYIIAAPDFQYLIKLIIQDQMFLEARLNKIDHHLLTSKPQATHINQQKICDSVKKNSYRLKIQQTLVINEIIKKSEIAVNIQGQTQLTISKLLRQQQKNNNKSSNVKVVLPTQKLQNEQYQNALLFSTTQILHNMKTQIDLQSIISFDQKNYQSFQKCHLLLLDRYIDEQPNKIIQMALKQHREVEQQMFSYADYLNLSRVGANTYVSEINMTALDNLINQDLKHTNKFIIQGKEELIQKSRAMRDFITRTRQRYDKLLKQMMSVIDRKTEFCRQFVNKVVKWCQNYVTRKEFLGNLRTDFCQGLFHCYSSFKSILNNLKQQKYSRQKIQKLISNVLINVNKMDEFVLIGNNFY